jgi:hypothetical protein
VGRPALLIIKKGLTSENTSYSGDNMILTSNLKLSSVVKRVYILSYKKTKRVYIHSRPCMACISLSTHSMCVLAYAIQVGNCNLLTDSDRGLDHRRVTLTYTLSLGGRRANEQCIDLQRHRSIDPDRGGRAGGSIATKEYKMCTVTVT